MQETQANRAGLDQDQESLADRQLSVSERIALENDPRYQELQRIKAALQPLPADQLEAKLQNIENIPQASLEAYEQIAQRLHARAKEKWAAVRKKLDGIKLSALTPENFRAYRSLGDFFLLKRECQKKKQAIRDRENAAFRAKYGEDLYGPLSNTPENVAQWTSRGGGHEPYSAEQHAVDMWVGEEGKKIRQIFQHGREDVQHQVDQWLQEVRSEYQSIVTSVRRIETELQRREGVEEARRQETERFEALRFTHNEDDPIRVKTNEVHEVWLWVSKGYPPYRLLMHVKANNEFTDRMIDKAGSFPIPFVFSQPGKHQALLQIMDRDLETKVVKLNFVVQGEEESQPSEGKPSVGSGGGSKQPAKPIAPNQPEKTKQLKPLVGRFKAELTPVPTIGAVSIPVAELTITISASGEISGQSQQIERAGSQKLLGKSDGLIHAKNRFRLSGHTDQKTGKTTFKIEDGWYETRSQYDDSILENRVSYSATYCGWRIPGLNDEPLLKQVEEATKIYQTSNVPSLISKGVIPKTKTSDDGKTEFAETGFLAAESSPHDRLSWKIEVLPLVNDGEAFEGTGKKIVSNDGKGFYLRILGPATVANSTKVQENWSGEFESNHPHRPCYLTRRSTFVPSARSVTTCLNLLI